MCEIEAIGRIDRRFRGTLPIYVDAAGEYCRIPLTRRMYAKVDPEDYCWLPRRVWQRIRMPVGQRERPRRIVLTRLGPVSWDETCNISY